MAALFRFLVLEFTNDHFVHLSRGAQILLGDLPIRDFFDPGLILQYYVSAATLRVAGYNLLGEAVVTSAFIGSGVGLTYLVSARLSRSTLIGLSSAFVTFLALPRLYNYPKAFLYVLALSVAWHHARRPGRGTLVLLASVTVLAFLFRHDHGVYVAASTFVFLVLLHWPDLRATRAALLLYGGTGLLLVSPFLLFVQITAGLPSYVRGASPQIGTATELRLNRLPLTIDLAAPLFTVEPPVERRINVRWANETTDDERRALESRYQLTRPERTQVTTWSYVPADERREVITALIGEPLVADTHGIDRSRGVVDLNEPLFERTWNAVPLLRLHVLPGVFTDANARAWSYYATLLVPLIGLAVLGLLLRRGQISSADAAVLGMAATLGVIVVQTLVRESPESRLPDVAGPICVTAACVAAIGVRGPDARRPSRAAWRTTLVWLLFFVSAWSVGADQDAGERLARSGILQGPLGVRERLGYLGSRLRDRPIDAYAPGEPGVPGLVRYLFDCTQPTDRVLVTWFQPDVFFYAERGFAGGQVYLHQGWHASPSDQALTIERLERQQVPVVLERADEAYRARFPRVHEYVQQHYVEAPLNSPAMDGYRVLVSRSATPQRTYEPLGLPCYR